jgi:hypothetical protein
MAAYFKMKREESAPAAAPLVAAPAPTPAPSVAASSVVQ